MYLFRVFLFLLLLLMLMEDSVSATGSSLNVGELASQPTQNLVRDPGPEASTTFLIETVRVASANPRPGQGFGATQPRHPGQLQAWLPTTEYIGQQPTDLGRGSPQEPAHDGAAGCRCALDQPIEQCSDRQSSAVDSGP